MWYTNAALPSRPWFCEHRNTITMHTQRDRSLYVTSIAHLSPSRSRVSNAVQLSARPQRPGVQRSPGAQNRKRTSLSHDTQAPGCRQPDSHTRARLAAHPDETCHPSTRWLIPWLLDLAWSQQQLSMNVAPSRFPLPRSKTTHGSQKGHEHMPPKTRTRPSHCSLGGTRLLVDVNGMRARARRAPPGSLTCPECRRCSRSYRPCPRKSRCWRPRAPPGRTRRT